MCSTTILAISKFGKQYQYEPLHPYRLLYLIEIGVIRDAKRE